MALTNREIDHQIAEKVMGQKTFMHPNIGEGGDPLCLEVSVDPVPRYSTDIAAAWRVLREIQILNGGPRKFYSPLVQLDLYEHDDIYTIRVGRCKSVGMKDDIAVHTYSWEQVPRAICLAALKAVGVEVPA